MAWIKADVRVQPMTEQLARKFTEMRQVRNERPLSTSHLEFLRHRIERHGALTFNWATADFDDEIYRIDGQHSSHLLCKHPELIHDRMKAAISEYMCESLFDLHDLYNQFDPKSGTPRSNADVNRSMAACTPGLEGIPDRVLNLAVTTLAKEKWGPGVYNAVQREDRAYVMAEEPKFVLFLEALRQSLTHPNWRVIARVAVITAVLMTWRKNKKDARRFWMLVATGEGPDAHSPDRLLNRYLLTTGVASGKPKNVVPGIGSQEPEHVMRVRCIRAWNAWRKNKKIATLRFTSGDDEKLKAL